MKGEYLAALVIIVAVVVIGLLFGVFLADVVWNARPPVAQSAPATAAPTAPTSANVQVAFHKADLAQAPKDLQEAILYGANIMTDTQKVLAQNVGNKVNCTNCHFEAGDTGGGKNGGISLAGVAATYPKYRDRQKYAVDLVARVND